jgi:hypothetical protein
MGREGKPQISLGEGGDRGPEGGTKCDCSVIRDSYRKEDSFVVVDR